MQPRQPVLDHGQATLSKPWVETALPVRIARSALAPNVPHADLYVTAHHSLLIDGVLVPAETLINGTTITRHEPESDEMEFFHIKLESHDVVYAEGAPAETLVHVDESFINFADYLRRYGAPVTETDAAPRLCMLAGVRNSSREFRSACRLGSISGRRPTLSATGWRNECGLEFLDIRGRPLLP